MAPTTRIGIIRIDVAGYWDIEDLLALSESLAESYGLFYPLIASEDVVRDTLHDHLRQKFWSGDIDTRHFGRFLYQRIPSDDGLKLRSFSYASAGVMEICGVLACLLMSRVRGFRRAPIWWTYGQRWRSFLRSGKASENRKEISS